MRTVEQIAVLHDLFNQINDRLDIIGETPDAYFLCQCVEILKQQGATIDAQATRITELEAQLADAKQANQWQPIETAPKDIPVLIFHNRMVIEAWYSTPWDKFVVSETGGSNLVNPTHWMPLPAAPAIAEGKQA